MSHIHAHSFLSKPCVPPRCRAEIHKQSTPSDNYYPDFPLHSRFCALFFPSKNSHLLSKLSNLPASGPNQIICSFHICSINFHPNHIISSFSTVHNFPHLSSWWRIIPMHKPGKPINFPASFRPISHSAWLSKLFESLYFSILGSFYR